jgi:chromosome segregation protein
MVHIKRLELRGFKSFGPKRVLLTLDRGFTVISGPNGSGKSNLLDAIKFVLGDLSARSLRADKMSGVIFDGQTSRKVDSSRVTLQFDNSDFQIPVASKTASISRQVNQNGASIYRLSGRQVTRSQLVNSLSVAGISSSGHNIIMQGTIMRLADVTPVERRKEIEAQIGIAEYDAKKNEAQAQLRQADINLRIASARIDEVQLRLDNLERERNQILRYNFIVEENKKLEAILVSFKMLEMQTRLQNQRKRLSKMNSEGESLRAKRESLIKKRNEVESTRRQFDVEIEEKGSSRLFSIHELISELGAQVASLKKEIEMESSNLKRLEETKIKTRTRFEEYRSNVNESIEKLNGMKREKEKIIQIFDEKTSSHKELSEKLTRLTKNMSVKTDDLTGLENEVTSVERELLTLNTKIAETSEKNLIIKESLDALLDRREMFANTVKELEKHLKELQKLRRNEEERLQGFSERIPSLLKRKEQYAQQVMSAKEIAQSAKRTILDFEARKSVAENLASEELALQRILELGNIGAIQGIMGKLEDLIRIDSKYERAIAVASKGWLKSVVVDDFDTATKCVENIKKMKLGRIKIIPLKEVSKAKIIEVPKIEGILGNATKFISCAKKYLPAVNFVFGDTIVMAGDRSALKASIAGYRTVDPNGNLFEIGGGLEGGYYRSSLDVLSILPKEDAIKDLGKNVDSLERMLNTRDLDIESLDEQIIKLTEERIRQTSLVETMLKEASNVKNNIQRAKVNVNRFNERINSLEDRLSELIQESALIEQRNAAEDRLNEITKQMKAFRTMLEPEAITKLESERELLDNEINTVQTQIVKFDSELSFTELNLSDTLKPELERINSELEAFDVQISSIRSDVENATKALVEANKQLHELEASRDALSESMSTVGIERKRFEDRLDQIDRERSLLENTYERLNEKIHKLEIDVFTSESELKHEEENLQDLGFSEPLSVEKEDTNRARTLLRSIRNELEQLGSVNQLAVSQYDQQKDNYKQLSLRMNEIESERRAIIEFMNKIEEQKRRVFISAFSKIDDRFKEFFNEMTDGGEGWMQIQNEEDPFTGGLDMFVKFPGKGGARLITGVSGGEKSVAAVCFILALQSISPAPFYIFDEIDAHLDPYYAERLADLLKKNSADSQFIVITLRDAMISRADRIFGVYVQRGTSRIASLRLPEVAIA